MTQSQKRFNESLGPLFEARPSKKALVLLKSSSDVGVIRNGGRNGAKYAPRSFLSYFRKLSRNEAISDFSFLEAEVASEEEELRDFAEAQSNQSERIGRLVNQNQDAWICHLGGGHDHVFPLLSALSEGRSKVIVINIDAHADTRTDDEAHSGTPFRQFASNFKGEFILYQIGLHPFANSLSTLEPLPRGRMEILWRDEIATGVEDFFEAIREEVTKETLVVFSVDADALDGAEVPGVSAVNGRGLSIDELIDLWERYHSLPYSHQPVLGLYELNPVYDSLSMLSMRRMAAFLFETMR